MDAQRDAQMDARMRVSRWRVMRAAVRMAQAPNGELCFALTAPFGTRRARGTEPLLAHLRVSTS